MSPVANSFFDAVEARNKEEVVKLLKKDSTLARKRNQNSETPLHITAMSGDLELTRVFTTFT